MKPSRPVLRYHGGKFRISEWVISHLPPHRVYLEAYAGAASVLMQKPRAFSEILNDLDGEIVALFRVLRDPAQARELERVLRLTPYSRAEFEGAYLPTGDPIECARRLICRAFMGHGSDGATRGCRTGFRNTAGVYGNGARTMGTTPAGSWGRFPDAIPEFCARLQGVLIENLPALRIIEQFDTPTTLHYVDPPYLWSTRGEKGDAGKRHGYRHEMTDQDHTDLAVLLHRVSGMVVLSGYPSELYRDLYGTWRRVERKSLADGARIRTECLWLNAAAASKLQHGFEFESEGA